MIYNYTQERDLFWKMRYPISKTLHSLYKWMGYASLIAGVLITVYLFEEYGMTAESLVPLIYGLSISLIMVFIAEIIVMQVDKNYLAYRSSDLHKIIEGSTERD